MHTYMHVNVLSTLETEIQMNIIIVIDLYVALLSSSLCIGYLPTHTKCIIH